MEWFGFIRRQSWKNAGFGSLINIRKYIKHTEPRFDPTVFPLEAAGSKDLEYEVENESPPVLSGQKKYSVAHYRSLFLSGELTPVDVVYAILPLIRRDTSPPGQHSMAWFDIKVDLVIKAAEASTLRYKEERSLGPLDGIPTAVKDEFDMEGYLTSLGSVNDYTGQELVEGKIDTWCVRKLEEAGVIILGKLSMHEFGMGKLLKFLDFSRRLPGQTHAATTLLTEPLATHITSNTIQAAAPPDPLTPSQQVLSPYHWAATAAAAFAFPYHSARSLV